MSTTRSDLPVIVELILYYKRSLEIYQNDNARLLYCMTKLYDLPITVEHLLETGIGKTVYSLVKFGGEIFHVAGALLFKWQTIALAQLFLLPAPVLRVRNECYRESSQERLPAELLRQRDNTKQRRAAEPKKYIPPPSIEETIMPSKEQYFTAPHATTKHQKSWSNHEQGSRKHMSITESKHYRNSSGSKHELENRHYRSQEEQGEKKVDQQKPEEVSKLNRHVEPDKKPEKISSHKHMERSSGHKDSNEKHSEKVSKEESHKAGAKHKKSGRESVSKSKEKIEKAEKSTHKSSHTREEQPTTSSKMIKQQQDVIRSKASKSSKKATSAETIDTNAYDEDFDSSEGISFAEVLRMLDESLEKSTTTTGSSTVSSSAKRKQAEADEAANSKRSKHAIGGFTPASTSTAAAAAVVAATSKQPGLPKLLEPTAKLEPLDPSIALELLTTYINFEPMSLNQSSMMASKGQ